MKESDVVAFGFFWFFLFCSVLSSIFRFRLFGVETAVAFFPCALVVVLLSLSLSLSLDTNTPGLCEMGVVFSSLWHWMFPGKEYKIVMVRSEEEEEEEEEKETKKEASTTTIDCMCRPLSLLFLSLSLACSMP